MARPKGSRNKAVKAVEPEQVQISKPDVRVEIPSPKRFTYPKVDGVQIVSVLETGHSKTHYHAQGVDSNGNKVTMHVSRKLFV